MPTKKELLSTPVKHIDITQHNVVALVDAMASMAYSSRDTARAAAIYEMMLRDTRVRGDSVPGRVADLGGLAEGVCRPGAQQHGGRDCVDRREHCGPGLLRGAGIPPLHCGRRVQVRQRRRGTARADDRPHLRHLHRRGGTAHLRRDDAEGDRLAGAAAI